MDYIDRLLFRVTEAGSIIRPRQRLRFEPLPPMEFEHPELGMPLTEIDDDPKARQLQELPFRPRFETNERQEADEAIRPRIHSEVEPKTDSGDRVGMAATTELLDAGHAMHPRRQNKPSSRPKDASVSAEARQKNPLLPDSRSDLIAKHQQARPYPATHASEQESRPRELPSKSSPDAASLSDAPERRSQPGDEKRAGRQQLSEAPITVEQTSRIAKNSAPTVAPVSENKTKAQDRQSMPGPLEPDLPRRSRPSGSRADSLGLSQNRRKVSQQTSLPEATININIGRIEVRATRTPAPLQPQPRPKSEPMSLDDYLNRKEHGAQ
jgi:hypothetical protein